jgi:hypothetical protein
MSRFGPTTGQITAVRNWLTCAGLTVTGVTDEIGGYVAVTGTVAAAERAFAVKFPDVPRTGREVRPRPGVRGDRAGERRV